MKVFVATREGQGARPNDFFWTLDEELVTFGSECCEAIDGPCGCRRSMVGLMTRKATTTFTVVDLALTSEEYFKIVRESTARSFGLLPPKEIDRWARGDFEELVRMAAAFPVGAVLEKRGGAIRERAVVN